MESKVTLLGHPVHAMLTDFPADANADAPRTLSVRPVSDAGTRRDASRPARLP